MVDTGLVGFSIQDHKCHVDQRLRYKNDLFEKVSLQSVLLRRLWAPRGIGNTTLRDLSDDHLKNSRMPQESWTPPLIQNVPAL